METEKRTRGKRGQGSVYLPKNSRFYWIKFSVNGRVIQESAETESRKQALDTLKARILKFSTGQGIDSRQTTVQDVRDGMLKEWRRLEKNPVSIAWAERCWKHVIDFFGTLKADKISSAHVREYTEARRSEKASNATINRELAVMSSGYAIAFYESPRRVSQKFSFSRLPEPKGRQGFVERAQYLKMANTCTEPFMRAMLALAYSFGFRRGELLALKVGDVDLLDGTVRLRTSKNGEPRQINLTEETRILLAPCIVGKSAGDAVFTRESGPVKYFTGEWEKITAAAGCPGLLFHDLRRSAVRGMIRAGVTEHVAMKISGHLTSEVFRRYNIVSGKDLADAAKKLESAAVSQSLAKTDDAQETQSQSTQPLRLQ